MKTKQVAPLSNYPSEAIRQAIEDLEFVEKQPKMEINMNTWGNGCAVCQAGAIAMRRYGWDSETCATNMISSSVNKSTAIQLLDEQVTAFDDLRQGLYVNFIRSWIDASDKELDRIADKLKTEIRPWITYAYNPKKYKANMLKVADLLESEGY